MKGEITSKGRRIYSLEPKKIVGGSTFARKYVNYFMPALLKIVNEKKRSTCDQNDGCICEVHKKVRYEVDMALVMSTEDQLFAWSHALKNNLNVGNPLKCTGVCDSSSSTSAHQANFSMKIIRNPNQKNPKIQKKKFMRRSSKRVIMAAPRMKNEEEKESNKEEKLISRKMMNLRCLLPGGSEMGADKLLSEFGSYILCLELQVNVLKCLIDNAPPS
ncbi:hypothetical protein ACOSP7_015740 [Xanthoceras sorbifolium]